MHKKITILYNQWVKKILMIYIVLIFHVQDHTKDYEHIMCYEKSENFFPFELYAVFPFIASHFSILYEAHIFTAKGYPKKECHTETSTA